MRSLPDRRCRSTEPKLDAPRGFEPRLTESESVVLPLDDGASAPGLPGGLIPPGSDASGAIRKTASSGQEGPSHCDPTAACPCRASPVASSSGPRVAARGAGGYWKDTTYGGRSSAGLEIRGWQAKGRHVRQGSRFPLQAPRPARTQAPRRAPRLYCTAPGGHACQGAATPGLCRARSRHQ